MLLNEMEIRKVFVEELLLRVHERPGARKIRKK